MPRIGDDVFIATKESGDRRDHRFDILGVFRSEYDANHRLGAEDARIGRFSLGGRVKVLLYQSDAAPTFSGTVTGRRVADEVVGEWCPVLYTVCLDPGQLPGPSRGAGGGITQDAPLRTVSRRRLRLGVEGTAACVEVPRDLLAPESDQHGLGHPEVLEVCQEPCPRSQNVLWFSIFEESDRQRIPMFPACKKKNKEY